MVFLIKYNNIPVGTIYFTFENSIGFFILDKYTKYSKKFLKGFLKKIKPLPKNFQ